MRGGLAALLLLLGGLACDDGPPVQPREQRPSWGGDGDGSYEPGTLNRDPAYPGVPGPAAAHASWFEAGPYGDPRCDGMIRDLAGVRELRLYLHPGAFELADYTQGLQRWFRRFGVRFETRHLPLEIPVDWVMDARPEVLREALEARFPEIDFDDPTFEPTEAQLEAVLRYAFEQVVGPLLDFVATYADSGPQITHLVVLPRIERTTRQEEERVVLGLALSPALLRTFSSMDNDEAQFWKYFPHTDFSPVLFLNGDALTALTTPGEHGPGVDPVLVDLTVAHELGHTLGLAHVDAPRNLMRPGFRHAREVVCHVELDASQLDLAQTTLSDVGTRSLALGAPEDTGARASRWRGLTDWMRRSGTDLPPFLRPLQSAGGCVGPLLLAPR